MMRPILPPPNTKRSFFFSRRKSTSVVPPASHPLWGPTTASASRSSTRLVSSSSTYAASDGARRSNRPCSTPIGGGNQFWLDNPALSLSTPKYTSTSSTGRESSIADRRSEHRSIRRSDSSNSNSSRQWPLDSGTTHSSVVASLNALDCSDRSVPMSASVSGMRRSEDAYAHRQSHSNPRNIADSGTNSTESHTITYVPRRANSFSTGSLKPFGHGVVPMSRNTQSVVACYNRHGDRNMGTADVIKELMEKEKKNTEEEELRNGIRVKTGFSGRLRESSSFFFDSLSLLLFTCPLFAIAALVSFFFFVTLEPFFFILSTLLFLLFHVVAEWSINPITLHQLFSAN